MNRKASLLASERFAISSLNVILYIGLPFSFLLCSAFGVTIGLGFQNQIIVTLSFFIGAFVGFCVGAFILILWVRIFAGGLEMDHLSDLIDKRLPENSPISKLLKAQLQHK